MPAGQRAREARSCGNVRNALAIILAGVALGGAVFLGTVHLKTHGHYHCVSNPSFDPGYCVASSSYWVAGRAVWQLPAAIVIAVVGLGGAAALARRTYAARPHGLKRHETDHGQHEHDPPDDAD